MSNEIRFAELFAGVGGFRLGLEGSEEFGLPPAGDFRTVWANQWEPPGSEGKQFAWRCYERRFGDGSCVNRDIHEVLDDFEAGKCEIPDVDMVTASTPCQSYSVARPLSKSDGIEGDKGVLWWDVNRFLTLKRPKYFILENVDRLLKSPARQRGRDFAIMLCCLNNLGYSVEWQVVNSAEYGFPQRRKRVYVFAKRYDVPWTGGVMAEAFPIERPESTDEFHIPSDPYETSQTFGRGRKTSPFKAGGVCHGHAVATFDAIAAYDGPMMALGDVIVPASEVPRSFWIPESQLQRWEYLKGAKREPRVAANGHEYVYSEGRMAFPDLLTNPSRTILTGEGGTSPSRFKHVIRQGRRLRRLVPEELEALQGFPKGWTDTGMSDGRRAFCMGNALIVGVVNRIGQVIAKMDASDVS